MDYGALCLAELDHRYNLTSMKSGCECCVGSYKGTQAQQIVDPFQEPLTTVTV
jgi:hypothetical protein